MFRLLAIAPLVLVAACSSSGSTSGQYKILSSNENAINIRVAVSAYSDQGRGIAQDHCSNYNKIAVRSGDGTGNGYRAVYTYECK